MSKTKNKKIHIILTEDELTNILNRFSVGMLSGNLDDDDKNLARKLNYALKKDGSKNDD